MSLIKLLFTLFCFLLIVSLSSGEPPISRVMEITDLKTFEDLIQRTDAHVLTYFYSKNCEACNKFEDDFITGTKQVLDKHDDVFIARINGPQNREIMKEHKVTRYPFIRFYPMYEIPQKRRGLRFNEKEHGGRNPEAIVKFVEDSKELVRKLAVEHNIIAEDENNNNQRDEL